MTLLGLDVGSSSVKATLLKDGAFLTPIVRAGYETRHMGSHVEVDADHLLTAVAHAIASLGPQARQADAVALSVMAPAWVAMDDQGNAVTPIVTHQDRRSVDLAKAIETRVGQDRILAIAGNRPFPGGISSTTCAWYLANEPARMKAATLVGHLNTLLVRRLTGRRVIDPSNASFTGLYRTVDQGGWSRELCEAVGVAPSQLPEIIEGDVIAGGVTAAAALAFGLRQGTPVLAGVMDTSAAMLYTGAAPGQLFNMCGSTDVLGMACDEPRPGPALLTRALGVGKKWMSVCTLAAAGSALAWARSQLFSEQTDDEFYTRLATLAREPVSTTVQFEPYLAGERTSIEQRQAAFTGITLATTREQMLRAVVESLAAASARRLAILERVRPPLRDVFVSGGGALIADLMHRDWPGSWTFREVDEAGLRGLGTLTPRQR